ncbi:MAG: DUF2232 domain-containing protein [Gammaproteobacteria bacterium]|nr:DUF2232 domain-containing protein [Gammaproteobacteria bacterium]
MLFLAKAIMKSPQQALMWSAMLGAATLVLSPFGVLSGAAVALVTLAAGLVPGLRALLASMAGAGLLTVFTGQWSTFSLAVLEFWLPAFALSVVLGASASLSRLLQVATGLMLLALVITYLWVGSPEAFWLETMRQLLEAWQVQGIAIEPTAASLLVEQLPAVLTMLVAMGLLLVWVTMAFLARWWQTRLYDMASFSTEFQAISLGNSLAVLMALMLVLVLFMPEQLLIQDALGVLSLIFMLQGLAVIHFWQRVKKVSQGWLILIYVLLGVLPQMMMMVATLGWLENWINWRDKIASDSQS